MDKKASKKFYWLKLSDDFFGDKAIKKLRKIAGGDTYTIIYLKMLLRAIKQDNRLYFEGVENNFAEELALDLNEDSENVKVTISFLQNQGLLQLVNDEEYLLTEGAKMTGQESESAERVRRYRDKKTLHCNGDVTECNGDVTKVKRLSNTEKEIEIEIDKEKEKEIIIESKDSICRTDVQRVVDAWNQLGINPVSKMLPTSKRYKMIAARIAEYGIDDVLDAINRIRESTFLRGGNNHGWMIDFEWFARPNNFPKVFEGKYDDDKKSQQGMNGPHSNNMANSQGFLEEWAKGDVS